jgi:hypothetical protein
MRKAQQRKKTEHAAAHKNHTNSGRGLLTFFE